MQINSIIEHDQDGFFAYVPSKGETFNKPSAFICVCLRLIFRGFNELSIL